MPLTETFSDDLTVAIGTATKASEYNNLSNNTDSLKERLEINHYFNNTGVANEDGYHKAGWSDPTFFYYRTGAGTGAWGAIWLDNTLPTNIIFRMKTATTKAGATPASITDGVEIGVGGSI